MRRQIYHIIYKTRKKKICGGKYKKEGKYMGEKHLIVQ